MNWKILFKNCGLQKTFSGNRKHSSANKPGSTQVFLKQKLVLPLSSFSPPNSKCSSACTWQLSIAIQWLWNNTEQDSKANNHHGNGHRRLKLFLRFALRGSYSLNTSYDCIVGYLFIWTAVWKLDTVFIHELCMKFLCKHNRMLKHYAHKYSSVPQKEHCQ